MVMMMCNEWHAPTEITLEFTARGLDDVMSVRNPTRTACGIAPCRGFFPVVLNARTPA